jgi:hypothetical protein
MVPVTLLSEVERIGTPKRSFASIVIEAWRQRVQMEGVLKDLQEIFKVSLAEMSDLGMLIDPKSECI